VSSINFYICSLNYSGKSKTADFLLTLLIPLTQSANFSDEFLRKKLKINPGA